MSNGSFPQAGFYYQNNIAALKILDSLKHDSDIIDIHLENYEKGNHIDDIILNRKNLIQYFQIKWSSDISYSYTVSNLVEKPESNKKSLIKQLADGFVSSQNQGKEIEIIFYSNRLAGDQKRPSKQIDKSLKDLINNFHANYINTDLEDITKASGYKLFEKPLSDLQQASGLDIIQFSVFFKKLRFVLGAPPLTEIKQNIQYKFENLGLETAQITQLLDEVVKWSITGEAITKTKILDQLGISSRFVDKVSHYFKVEEPYYIANDKLFGQLDKALSELSGGYIFVEGVPGSGKSTALTKYKTYNSAVKFAYYCFIPDERSFGDLRQRSDYFLKSLCIAIESSFPHVEFPIRYSGNYQEKLVRYLEKLSEAKEKIIFIIDGLDHVDRNRQNLESPLTSQIIGDLPDNIFFIISSQYLEALPADVKTKIRADERRHIQLARFSKPKIKKYLDKKGIELREEEFDNAAVISEGIPLYLYYISELLAEQTPDQYKIVIQKLPKLIDGKITTYHHLLYEQIRQEEVMIWILALLAFRKEYTTEKILKRLLEILGVNYNEVQINIALKQFRHLLKEHEASSYSIFHNSFREFILNESGYLKEIINNSLIKFYEEDIWTDEAFRNYFQHLFESGLYAKILQSTNDEWIRKAWFNLRPLHEIDDNLDIAWNASAELTNLSEFVRICFLKQQLGLSSDKLLQSSDFDFSIFLLNSNQLKESLRTIWDGERVLEHPKYFGYYSIKYFERTSTLLPAHIAAQSFSNLVIDKITGEEYEENIKARSLYENVLDLIAEIKNMNWTSANKANEYEVEKYSADKNKKIGISICRKLIYFLGDHSQTAKLSVIVEAIKEASLLRLSLSELTICLFKQKSPEARRLLEKIEFQKLSKKEKARLINKLVNYISVEEIRQNYRVKIIAPKLEEEVVSKEFSYKLKDEIIDLYPHLRLYYLYNPESIAQFELKLSSLPYQTRAFYYAISSLSKLWLNMQEDKLMNRTDIISSIKTNILSTLNVPLSYQTGSNHSDNIFISSSIYKVYKHIFDFIADTCTDDEINGLADYWIKQQYHGAGYVSYQNSLEFALCIKDRASLTTTMHQLIMDAESIARDVKETITLVSELYHVGNAFGICGFTDEANRIYQEILPLSCGVGYRKDYQFSDIIDVLKKAHISHPEKTLNRLAEIYKLLHQVREAGNPRMYHICQSILISFAYKIFPSLAFQLFEVEDNLIDRDEAFFILLREAIPETTEENYEFVWAIIKTITKWDRDGSNNAESAYHLFFKQVIHSPKHEFILRVYNYIKREILVFKNEPAELIPFINIAQEAGHQWDIFINDLSIFTPAKLEIERKKNLSEKSKPPKFLLPVERKTIPELIMLANESFDNIPAYIKQIGEQIDRNTISQQLRSEFYQINRLLSKWSAKLKPNQQQGLKKSLFSCIRSYIYFKKTLVEELSGKVIKKTELINRFISLVKEIDKNLKGLGLKKYVQKSIDLDSLIENLIGKISWRGTKLSGVLSDEEIFEIIKEIPSADTSKWVSFANEYLSGENQVAALTFLAKRLSAINPEKALDLLNEGYENLQEVTYREKETELELMRLYFSLAPGNAKKLLLYNFIKGSSKYPSSILYYLETKLIVFADHFEEPDLFENYFEANFGYNQKLAEGLPVPEINADFISLHKEECNFSNAASRYLVSLFNYPKVKIRQLALKSLSGLITSYPDLLTEIIKYFTEGNSNCQEHGIVLMQSLALRDPVQLTGYENILLKLLDSPHFNISQTCAELILFLSDKQVILEVGIIQKAKSANRKPAFPIQKIIRNMQHGYSFAYNYQNDLLHDLNEGLADRPTLSDEVYTNLLERDWNKAEGRDVDAKIHKWHNMNSNFDRIEINGPYYSTIQNEINIVFKKRISNGDYENSFINRVKNRFRLYDPSDISHENIQRPDYISWITNGINPADFMAYTDSNSLLEQFTQNDQDILTLYENGSQRSHQYPNDFTTYFELCAFLSPLESENELIQILSEEYVPFLHIDNYYRSELPGSFPVKTELLEDAILPIIGVSYRNYRNQMDYSIASLLPSVIEEMKLNRDNDFSLDFNDSTNDRIVTSFLWQEKFDDHGRRRFKPNSEGFILRAKREDLWNYIRHQKMNLYFFVNLRRSVDKYIPESEMNWKSLTTIKKYAK